MKKRIRLGEVTDIRVGLHAQPEEEGEFAYLQARQFDNSGKLVVAPDVFINIDNKSHTHLLEDGDILFVGKGYRNFAWCYRQSFGPSVASSTFFVIRPVRSVVYPEYLAAFFNLPRTQTYFQQLGSGTNIISIRKSELEAFEVPVPPIEEQHRIVEMDRLHKREIEIHQQLILKKQQLYNSIISTLIK